MKGQEVVLTDMLACRERRVNIQNEYIQRYHCPVISFCMNIPGPIKTNEQIKKAFLSGKEALFAVLQKENIPILTQTEFDEKTGNEIILTVDYPADKIKELTTELEENHPFGRLFDMDVIGTDGEKLSRGVYRKCLICGCQAQECARSRKHTAGEDRRDALITILRNGRMHFQTAFSRFLISITIFLKISLPAPVSPDVLLSSSPSRPYGTNAQIYNHTSGILRSNGIPDVHGTACCSLSDIHRLLPDIQCMHID